MRAGALIHIIDILKVESIPDDGYNSSVRNEVPLYQGMRASIKYDGFSEGESINQQSNGQLITFRIWYRKEITEDCIVVFNGCKYNVIGIEIIGRNRELFLKTSKVNG